MYGGICGLVINGWRMIDGYEIAVWDMWIIDCRSM